MKHSILITIFCLISLTLTFGQISDDNDSIEVCRITTDFFKWYLNAISGKEKSVFQPRFVESPNGMTALDFNDYFKNLKKHNFTADLIKKEKDSYNECLENLEKIKYSDFKTQFTDLDQFENISCDFENYYRWTGGQEPIQGIRIKEVSLISNTQAKVTIDYFFDNGNGYGIAHWGNNVITLLMIKDHWKINDINWKN